MFYMVGIKNKEFKYSIKNPIDINIKKLSTFKEYFPSTPPKNFETTPKIFFQKNILSISHKNMQKKTMGIDHLLCLTLNTNDAQQ